MQGKALHADVRAAVYRLAVKSGDADAYTKILSMYKDVGGLLGRQQPRRGWQRRRHTGGGGGGGLTHAS